MHNRKAALKFQPLLTLEEWTSNKLLGYADKEDEKVRLAKRLKEKKYQIMKMESIKRLSQEVNDLQGKKSRKRIQKLKSV